MVLALSGMVPEGKRGEIFACAGLTLGALLFYECRRPPSAAPPAAATTATAAAATPPPVPPPPAPPPPAPPPTPAPKREVYRLDLGRYAGWNVRARPDKQAEVLRCYIADGCEVEAGVAAEGWLALAPSTGGGYVLREQGGEGAGWHPIADVAGQIAALLSAHPDNICLNTFDPAYYASLPSELQAAFLKCLASGIENPDSGMGCYACQPEDYDRFKPFFCKALAKYHGVAEDAKHVNDWSLEGVEGLPEGGVLDIAKLGLPALSMRVRTGRNLRDFPLPGAMTKEQRCELETRMLTAFEVLFKDPAYGGRYCLFNDALMMRRACHLLATAPQ
jgi:hypothetical protein